MTFLRKMTRVSNGSKRGDMSQYMGLSEIDLIAIIEE